MSMNTPSDIYTVAQLIDELGDFPPDALVMLAVVKYPGEFSMRADDEGTLRWDLGTDVEVVPFELGDLTLTQGQAWITVELAEYNIDRALLNGAGAAAE